MFVCPSTRLTLSMGMPLLSANVAKPCLAQWKEMSFVMPHSLMTFLSLLQTVQ